MSNSSKNVQASVCDIGSRCCGCGACQAVCHHVAIAMKPDHDGFMRPVVDKSICVNCGLCRKVCPLCSPSVPDLSPECFAFQTNDAQLLAASSSGGAFSELARPVIEDGGCVFGCALSDHDLKPVHIKISSLAGLSRLRGSKYAQSDVGDTYAECKRELQSGRRVCFSGTPCQIRGLKLYLGKNYPNLLMIDIICHGVPSPKVLVKYKAEEESKARSVLKRLDFRCKAKSWVSFSMSAGFDDRTCDFIEGIKENLYLRVFLSNLPLRESCFDCPVRNGRSGADITLADFWGVQDFCPEMFDDRGTSIVLIHSAMGKVAFEDIRMCGRVREVAFESAVAHNPSYRINAARPDKRDRFFREIDRRPLADAFRVCTKRSLFSRIISRIRRSALSILYSN